MGPRVTVAWSSAALDDVDEIAAYIGRDSVHYSSAVVRSLGNAAREAGLFPRSGRVVPELADETFREKFVYSYRLIYHVEAERVLVVTVIHGERRLVSDSVLRRVSPTK
ncbi:MAG: type II toxin-antitoxin system RelE/ParE family toxin [Gemmatimonadaceae bacterium]